MTTISAARQRMLKDSGASERSVTVDGIRTSVLEAGNGPPLLLLHGGVECGGAMWAPIIPQLAGHFRVIVPDVPGAGESEPFDHFDVDSFSSWLSRFMTAVEMERPVVVAHSLIGSLAARFAAGRGNELRRLVIYAAPGVGPYRMPLRLYYVAIRLALRPTLANDERFSRFALLDFDATRNRDSGWFDAFSTYSLECAVLPPAKRMMKQLIKVGTKRIADDDLRRIGVPVDLIWGESDRMVPPSVGKGARQRLGWPIHIVTRSAHAPHIEQPDDFVKTLGSIQDSEFAPSTEVTAHPASNSDLRAMADMAREVIAR